MKKSINFIENRSNYVAGSSSFLLTKDLYPLKLCNIFANNTIFTSNIVKKNITKNTIAFIKYFREVIKQQKKLCFVGNGPFGVIPSCIKKKNLDNQMMNLTMHAEAVMPIEDIIINAQHNLDSNNMNSLNANKNNTISYMEDIKEKLSYFNKAKYSPIQNLWLMCSKFFAEDRFKADLVNEKASHLRKIKKQNLYINITKVSFLAAFATYGLKICGLNLEFSSIIYTVSGVSFITSGIMSILATRSLSIANDVINARCLFSAIIAEKMFHEYGISVMKSMSAIEDFTDSGIDLLNISKLNNVCKRYQITAALERKSKADIIDIEKTKKNAKYK